MLWQSVSILLNPVCQKIAAEKGSSGLLTQFSESWIHSVNWSVIKDLDYILDLEMVYHHNIVGIQNEHKNE